MRDRILPRLGPMQLRKVRPGHVQAVLDEMTRNGRAGRTVSHAQVEKLQHEVLVDRPNRGSQQRPPASKNLRPTA